MHYQKKPCCYYNPAWFKKYAKVLYMSFDKFLLAVESRDLSQADKSIVRVSSFPKLFLNNKIYSYGTSQSDKIDVLAYFIIRNLQDWKVNILLSFSGER